MQGNGTMTSGERDNEIKALPTVRKESADTNMSRITKSYLLSIGGVLALIVVGLRSNSTIQECLRSAARFADYSPSCPGSPQLLLLLQ
jgi:hypothetical protein